MAIADSFPGVVYDLTCPECGARMVPRYSEKFGPRVFYSCSTWPTTGCTGRHGAHPDGSPLGIPADQATRNARIRAHDAFDAMWQGMGMRRDDAYRWLAKQLGLEAKDAHIGKLTLDQCEKLVAAVDRTLTRGRPHG